MLAASLEECTMGIYGKDYAAVYNDRWGFFGLKMWPFLSKVVRRHQPRAETWLDLCCGTGSLLELVCENDFSATGVDASRHQLKHARQNAPCAKLVRADVREFSLPGKFDVITCMFDSLNYLTTKQDLTRAFRRARHHLQDDGLFIFDVNTFESLRSRWCSVSTIREPDRMVIVDTAFDEKRALGRCLITGFAKEGHLWRRFEEEHVERGYIPQEIDDLLERVGFSFGKYDGDTLSRPRKRSGRLIYVCRRP